MKRTDYRLSLAILLVAALSCGNGTRPVGPDVVLVKEFISFTQFARHPLRRLPEKEAWRRAAPRVVEIAIPRNGGEPDQPALWYHSGSPRKKPLLLVLHSWSDSYLQHYGIPYGVFAEKNDWIFIHPDYRGAFNAPDATGSEKAIRDVLDALAYAKAHAPVDEKRIYLAGFSGGAMMSLIMIGRFPERFTAALVWVPVFDLIDWYRRLSVSGLHYRDEYIADIEASCGGNPLADAAAEAQCRARSPSRHLGGQGPKRVKVFISGGVKDPFVPTSHAIRAFNALAEEMDSIPEAEFDFIDKADKLPESLVGQGRKDPLFEAAGLPVILHRTSGNATLVLLLATNRFVRFHSK